MQAGMPPRAGRASGANAQECPARDRPFNDRRERAEFKGKPMVNNARAFSVHAQEQYGGGHAKSSMLALFIPCWSLCLEKCARIRFRNSMFSLRLTPKL